MPMMLALKQRTKLQEKLLLLKRRLFGVQWDDVVVRMVLKESLQRCTL